MPQLLAVFLRHSGHPGDDFDRERTGEVLHDVEVVGINRAEVFVGHLVHVIHLRLNGPRSESLVEQAAHVTVVRRVHEDHHLAQGLQDGAPLEPGVESHELGRLALPEGR